MRGKCNAGTNYLRVIPSATRSFNDPAFSLQKRYQYIPLIALNFDNPIFNGATGSTFCFQGFSEDFQFFVAQRDTHYQGYPFTFSPLCFAAYPNHAIANRARTLPTGALCYRLTATGTHAPLLRRKNQASSRSLIHYASTRIEPAKQLLVEPWRILGKHLRHDFINQLASCFRFLIFIKVSAAGSTPNNLPCRGIRQLDNKLAFFHSPDRKSV